MEAAKRGQEPAMRHKQSPEQEKVDRQNLGGAWQDDLSVVVGSRLRILPIYLTHRMLKEGLTSNSGAGE